MAADSQDHTVVIHVTPGEVLGDRWRVESRLGQGAMGSVFRGRDLTTQGLVAIKILAPEHCRKPKVLARFEREAEKMTGLRHPNIVQLHGHGRRGALPYIVMEYLDGMTLADVLQHEGGTLPLPETIALVKQLALGLAFLHKNGLVHRDVKPQNVIVNGEGRVTILDLGVVRDQANPGLTRPGAMVGTPYYMSPEQILGAEDIDKRTDVYALAAMTFELLTGRPPFLGENNFEVLYGHKNLPPPDASKVQASVPQNVGKVLMRALSKRRDERPDTVTELVAELEAAAGPKKVDLSRRFAFASKRAPQKGRDEKREDQTRILKPAPSRAAPTKDAPPSLPPRDTRESPSGEVPMAESGDVVSVPGLAVGESHSDLRTVVMRVDEVEEQPRHTTDPGAASGDEEPPAEEAPKMGQLRVVVTARGKAANAAVSVDGIYEGVTPRTLTLTAGTHKVKIEMAGYKAVERTAEVTAESSANLRVVLEKA
ncbi:MAG: serine/threonine-protein kinase [Myxococcota bacterium]